MLKKINSNMVLHVDSVILSGNMQPIHNKNIILTDGLMIVDQEDNKVDIYNLHHQVAALYGVSPAQPTTATPKNPYLWRG